MSGEPGTSQSQDTTPDSDDRWLQHVITLARDNVGAGGGPFGAVVVAGGKVLAEGVNRVTRDLDPTAHAEVVAIRAAAQAIGDFSLKGAVLYTSCEPCPLCMSAALWARLDRVVYAADRDDAARGGFDDRAFYDLFATERSQWPTSVAHVTVPAAFAPFERWLDKGDRVTY
ncbi:nucleoside deaminase [Luteipulveratus mongoliensis]|uniref:Cytosine deaminase n=1 Tax=Luteipulveratus mongoliensis TaxID=571913 RepID=A0A0K1JJU7_9MICO|nr:nucleoside deaminase [Luteipulveratus mongoliensis]AKU16858.1 cytosine deaminase [Luteipulveratus mongoliensis]